MMKRRNPDTQKGFTVVELMATVIVAAMFAVMFYQLFVTIVQIGASVRRDADASDLAYSNLKKFPTASSVSATGKTITCGGAAVLIYPPTGDPISHPTLGIITQTVKASLPSPFCSSNPDLIKIESSVTYNNNGSKTITHVTYLN